MIDFVDKLKARLTHPLPGIESQNQMKARRSSGKPISFAHEGPPRQGGVAVLLYQDQGSWYFPLMKRREYQGVHSGQVSLPGGKLESTDHDLVETAVRESREELGVDVGVRHVIGSLTDLYIIASHFSILPVVAVMNSPPVLRPDDREVEQVIQGSLDQLLLPGAKKEKDILVRGYDIRAPYFDIENHVVWGATAMILNEFLSVVREISHA